MANLEKAAVVLVFTQVKDLIKMDLSQLPAPPVAAPTSSRLIDHPYGTNRSREEIQTHNPSSSQTPHNCPLPGMHPAADAITADICPETAQTSHAWKRARGTEALTVLQKRPSAGLTLVFCWTLQKEPFWTLTWSLAEQKVATPLECCFILLTSKAGVKRFLFKDKASGCRL